MNVTLTPRSIATVKEHLGRRNEMTFLTEYSKGGYLYTGFAEAENTVEAQKICDVRGLGEKVVGPLRDGADIGDKEGRPKQ